MEITNLKLMLCAALGCIGSLMTLIAFMAADYISGMVVAGVFHSSDKTESGGLESRAGWKGLCRKGMTLLIVLIAHRLDIATGSTIIRDAVVIAYICNEAISITENAGLMGVPIPERLIDAVDVLQGKGK